MKTYIDTSVFGGYSDIEFEESTKLFFDEIEKGLKIPVISDLIINELEKAPEEVKNVFNRIESKIIVITIERKIIDLADEYIKAGALTLKSFEDAVHIASATVGKVDVIVSWNFKHIVNLHRIKIYNEVNQKQGYPIMEIRTPREVLNIK